MDNELLVMFCRARQQFQERQRQTSEERSEAHETFRSVSALLTESMRRQSQGCIRCVHDDGKTLYIRLVQGGRRALTLRNTNDVVRLLDNVAANVTHVSREDLPDAVARLVESRARALGTDTPSRIAIVPRVGTRETIVEQNNTTRELQTLTTQMTHNHVERKRIREEMVPVRRELKTAEEKLCDTVSKNDSREVDEVVQIHTPKRDGNLATKTVSVRTEVRPKKRNIFGLRNVCRCVREAVQNVAERDEAFDDRLRCELLRVIEREQSSSQESSRRVVVKRQRVAAPPLTTA
jgi:hypothetical protein